MLIGDERLWVARGTLFCRPTRTGIRFRAFHETTTNLSDHIKCLMTMLFSHTHPHSLSLSNTHTETIYTPSLSLSLSLWKHMHTHAKYTLLALSPSFSLSLWHTHHTNTHSLPLSLSITHIYTLFRSIASRVSYASFYFTSQRVRLNISSYGFDAKIMHFYLIILLA